MINITIKQMELFISVSQDQVEVITSMMQARRVMTTIFLFRRSPRFLSRRDTVWILSIIIASIDLASKGGSGRARSDCEFVKRVIRVARIE